MSRIYISLDKIDGIVKSFTVEEIKDPEKIREKLSQNKAPIFVYDEGKIEKRVGKDELLPGHHYVWFSKHEIWQNKEIVQNALCCAEAVYKPNPYQELKVTLSELNTVREVVGFGCYCDDDREQRCLISLAENEQTGEKMLIISFKGSKIPNDWRDNINISMKADHRYLGKFHEGFYQRAKIVKISDIKEMAELRKVNIILTCGHSLGGAVSSIVHMNILRSCESSYPIEKKNIINITFGSPYFGNERLRNHAREKDFSRNMFHFTSVQDIIPSLLSLGHSVKSVQDQMKANASVLTLGFSEVWRQLEIKSTMHKLNTVSNVCQNALQIYFHHTERGKESLLKEIYECSCELNKSLEASSLQNQYKENSFVPIGQYVILANGREAEMLDHGSKIIERILQAAVEQASKACNIRDIFGGHQVQHYMEQIKTTFDGFQEYLGQSIKLNKEPIEGCFQDFKFENLSRCAYNDCDRGRNSIPICEQIGSVICKTCEADANKDDFLFHKDCSSMYHANVEDHSIQPCRRRDPIRSVSEAPTLTKCQLCSKSNVRCRKRNHHFVCKECENNGRRGTM
eukprot:GFUD01088260.1.p1 GENE.GFUD01088260.1~~GFUD01088260.1.p1  ORF type:complete len:571 (-),score=92.20 GFUD01088260.1:215-1927(-)